MTRSNHIKVYVSEEERRQIEEQAEKHNRSVSSYMRHKIKEELPAEATTA